ncbi:TnsA endonuclease N-terminal domain-containing protein [Paenibacillus sp. BR2-3]|uniref:TnsA endonuclease N-terminal domain-containing protein n=1 Tax=Paenibacillus sp. BR2-3 TaxID=3048494 RepID=UPI003977270F
MEKPARKIKASRGKHHRFQVPFLRTKSMILCESSIERDYVKVLDFDPSIVKVISQPIKITYIYRGKKRKYYPDFKVITITGEIWIIEIKPEGKLRTEENLIKYAVGQSYCSQLGWEYKIVTDTLIRPGYFQKNLSLLRSLGTQPVETKDLLYITQKLMDLERCKISELRGRCSELETENFYKAIYSLIYHHNIYTDLISQELNDEAEVSIQLEV